jgi:hypothetical protein
MPLKNEAANAYNNIAAIGKIDHYRPLGPGGLQGLPLGLVLGRQSAICALLCAKTSGFVYTIFLTSLLIIITFSLLCFVIR